MLRRRFIGRSFSLLADVQKCERELTGAAAVSRLFAIAERVREDDLPCGAGEELCSSVAHIIAAYARHSVTATKLIGALTNVLKQPNNLKHISSRDARHLALAYRQLSMTDTTVWITAVFLSSMSPRTGLIPLRHINQLLASSTDDQRHHMTLIVRDSIALVASDVYSYSPADHFEILKLMRSAVWKFEDITKMVEPHYLKKLFQFQNDSGIYFLWTPSEKFNSLRCLCSLPPATIEPYLVHITPIIVRIAYYLSQQVDARLDYLCTVTRGINTNRYFCKVDSLRMLSHHCLERVSDALQDSTQHVIASTLCQVLGSVLFRDSVLSTDLEGVPTFQGSSTRIYEPPAPTRSVKECVLPILKACLGIEYLTLRNLAVLLKTSRKFSYYDHYDSVIAKLNNSSELTNDIKGMVEILRELTQNKIRPTLQSSTLARKCIASLEYKVPNNEKLKVCIASYYSKIGSRDLSLISSINLSCSPDDFDHYLRASMSICRSSDPALMIPLFRQFVSLSFAKRLGSSQLVSLFLRTEPFYEEHKTLLKDSAPYVLLDCVNEIDVRSLSRTQRESLIDRCLRYPSIYFDAPTIEELPKEEKYMTALVQRFQKAIDHRSAFTDDQLLKCLLMLVVKTDTFDSRNKRRHALSLLPGLLKKSISKLKKEHLLKTLSVLSNETDRIQDIGAYYDCVLLVVRYLHYSLRMGHITIDAKEAASAVGALGRMSAGKVILADLNRIINENPSGVPPSKVADVCSAFSRFRFRGSSGASAAVANEDNLTLSQMTMILYSCSLAQCANSVLWESLGSRVMENLPSARWGELTTLICAITASSLYHPPLNVAIMNRVKQFPSSSDFRILNYLEDVKRRDAAEWRQGTTDRRLLSVPDHLKPQTVNQ
eukprot:TRINITY_DN14815_c1_g1_i1.p1 TRINITY_DN14815_c1_g1~~TRINITY_DN14815_c1_g1_i1.p1  ORF type:complete len:885 (+),score=93.13 TRINITY_DN14815_c1_g1_i1:43-2697(+)